MARAAEGLGVTDVAIDAYRALLLMDPVDPAEVHYRLAFWLERRGELELARRHVLQSLEEAPRFRAAHGLLLKLHESSPGPAGSSGSSPAPRKGQEQHTDPIEEGRGKSDAQREAKGAGQ